MAFCQCWKNGRTGGLVSSLWFVTIGVRLKSPAQEKVQPLSLPALLNFHKEAPQRCKTSASAPEKGGRLCRDRSVASSILVCGSQMITQVGTMVGEPRSRINCSAEKSSCVEVRRRQKPLWTNPSDPFPARVAQLCKRMSRFLPVVSWIQLNEGKKCPSQSKRGCVT